MKQNKRLIEFTQYTMVAVIVMIVIIFCFENYFRANNIANIICPLAEISMAIAIYSYFIGKCDRKKKNIGFSCKFFAIISIVMSLSLMIFADVILMGVSLAASLVTLVFMGLMFEFVYDSKSYGEFKYEKL